VLGLGAPHGHGSDSLDRPEIISVNPSRDITLFRLPAIRPHRSKAAVVRGI
jgi:hypothetical protein